MKTAEQDKYGAADKCRAVLTVWTERKQASVLCREMGVSGSLFSQWQDRAVSGMLEALEPRGTREGVEGPALPAQFKRLLDRKARARDLLSLGRIRKIRPVQEGSPSARLPSRPPGGSGPAVS
jgi:transposase-like protein